MMKPLHINLLTFFSLLFLSHAQQLETINFLTDLTSIVDTKPQHHHHESSSSDVGVSKIPTSELDRARSLPSEKVDVQPEAKQTTVDPGFTEVDLRQFINRSPVHLRNRFPFPRVLRFFPRRCNHKQQEQRFFRFAHPDIRFDGINRPLTLPRPVEADQNVIGLMFRKNGQEMVGQVQGQGQGKAAGRSGPFAEILQHHHMPRKFPEAQEELMMFEFKQPNYHLLHHHHQHHDDGGDDDDDHEEKEKMEKYHHHHRHDDDREEKENGLVKKIRKFLAHF